MTIIPKLSCALEKKLWEQVLNYFKQDKTAYLNYRSIIVCNKR